MKLPVIMVLASLLAVTAAHAQQDAPGGAGPGSITVTKRDCARVVRHQPSADVEFKPGVDVRGKRVKSADLGGSSPIRVPDAISIDIGIDMDERFDLDDDYSADTQSLGTVTVKRGAVYFNGHRLGDGAQAEIAAACRRQYGR